jgi:DNA-binding CsgD family transcriptional regulator
MQPVDAPSPGGLLGRERELEHLLASFATCRTRHAARVVLVHGVGGVGTSALARRLRDELQRRQLAHAWWLGRCSRQAPLVYEPVAGLLRDVPGHVGAWLAEAADAGGAESAGLALVAGLARRVREAALARPVVLVVDDVDGADASTVRLLTGVVPLLDDVPVLVLLVGRSDTAGRAPHSWEHLADEVLVTEPLDAEQMAALARDLAPGLAEPAVRAVVDAAGGLPAVAAALVAAGDAEHTLAAVLDGLHPAAGVAVAAADLAAGRLDAVRLGPAVGVPPEVWALLVHRRVLRAPERPTGAPLPASEWWVAAAHRRLGGEVARVAAVLAPLLDDDAPAALAARAWELAGRPEVAGDRWELAADEALAGHAIETAAAAARRALDLGGDAAVLRRARRAAELSLVAGDRLEADAIAARLLPRLERHDVPARLAMLLLSYRARLEAGLDDHDQPLDLALELPAPACREHVDVLVVDALRRVLDEPAAAARTATRALDEARALGDPAAVANAAGAAGLAAAIGGDLTAGLAHFDEALDAAARSGDGALEARLASNRVFVLWRAGRPRDVERVAADELERLAVRGLSALGDQLAVGRVGALITLGRLDDATVAVAAARSMRMAADPVAHLDLADASLALLRGELDRADVLVTRVGTSPAGELAEVVGERYAVRAALEAARGDRRAARDAAVEGLRRCGAGDLVARWRLLLAWWRVADGLRPPAEIADVPSPEVVGAELVAAAATVDACRDPSVSSWRAAIEAWSAVPAPLDAVRCELALATLDRDLAAIDDVARRARAAGAVGIALEADAAYRAAGGRRAPTRVAGLLSTRELEVLHCVAEGLTNREIADRLFISVRTVGAHLERCATKLDVRTRGAAVHEARRRGLMG